MYFSPLIPHPRERRSSDAFSLLELLAVLAVIAILAAVMLGVGRRTVESGRIARAKAELAALSAALESYKRQHGDYPRTSDNATLVQSLIGKLAPAGSSLANAGRAHLAVANFTLALASAPDSRVDPFGNAAAVLLDPWSRPYRYAYRTQTPWTNPSFVLSSVGPDGADHATLLAGGFVDGTAAANTDNLYAHRH